MLLGSLRRRRRFQALHILLLLCRETVWRTLSCPIQGDLQEGSNLLLGIRLRPARRSLLLQSLLCTVQGVFRNEGQRTIYISDGEAENLAQNQTDTGFPDHEFPV